jgi:hypothetical protein
MRENEVQLEDRESQKARIRARYKGIGLDGLPGTRSPLRDKADRPLPLALTLDKLGAVSDIWLERLPVLLF